MGHAHEKDIELSFAVIEALVSIAKLGGSADAEEFLSSDWPDMKAVLRKRWLRAGLVHSSTKLHGPAPSTARSRRTAEGGDD